MLSTIPSQHSVPPDSVPLRALREPQEKLWLDQRAAQGPIHCSLPAQLLLSILVFSISLGPGMLLFPARQPLSLNQKGLEEPRMKVASLTGQWPMTIRRAPCPERPSVYYSAVLKSILFEQWTSICLYSGFLHHILCQPCL